VNHYPLSSFFWSWQCECFSRCQDWTYVTSSIGLCSSHCMTHQTNVVIQALSKLNMICRLENLLQTLYAYSNKSFNRHLKLNKHLEIMEIQGNKLLKNVKTRWISMLEFAKRVISEYHTLMVKMALDFAYNNSIKVNFKLLCDIEVYMGWQSCCHYWRKLITWWS
jgi:hypothetical protein